MLGHPWLALPAAALLILFALPTFALKLGIDLGLAAISDTPSGKAEIILAESFSAGRAVAGPDPGLSPRAPGP